MRNSGFKLWSQQIKSLFLKRFWIFFRRTILAICILVIPWLFEAVVVGILPSTSSQISQFSQTVSASGTYTLALNSYGSNVLPYYLNGTASTTVLQTYLTSRYASSGVTLNQITSDPNDYVLSQRKANIQNIYSNYYLGMLLNLVTGTKLNAIVYYNSMAFHSSANILNEIDNLLYYVANSNNQDYTVTTVNSPIAANSSAKSSASFLEALACIDSQPVTLLNFIISIIIALIMSFQVIHVARERINGSKQMQMLSGIHYVTYWIANYLFDLIIMLFQCTMLVIMLAIVNAAKSGSSDYEVYYVASNGLLGYAYILLLFSCVSWCTYAYIWSFLFKQDIVGFVVLLLALGVLAYFDTILVFIQLLFVTSNNNKSNGISNLIAGIRVILALLFPNVS